MFTGIIQEVGTIDGVEEVSGGRRLRILAPRIGLDLHTHDSVAVNGVCLTVVFSDNSSFQTEAVEETLKKTTCAYLTSGDAVNLEPALRVSDRLGGHVVLGHVDAVGQIMEIEKRELSWMLRISYPAEFSKYVIPVGSVCIDGISLTVAELYSNTIGVSIIPHTMENTNLRTKRVGSKVNIEFDALGKYIVNLYEQHVDSDIRKR
jgi:riboflavin synthase